MTEASSSMRRVTHVNANWRPAAIGDGRFELLIVTEDDQRRVLPVSASDFAALTGPMREDAVLLWDLEDQTLILGNLFGRWIPSDWSSTDDHS